jgi:DNA-binding response OmpR family regulator
MNRSTVLVVEDDAAIRRGLVDALRFADYEVVDCDNGIDAVPLAVESSVDVVLLDVMLPGQDGFDVLRALRTSHPALPVIMVTARGAEEDRVRGLQDGADDYVVKPFSAKELLARVEAVLRRSPGRTSHVAGLSTEACAIDLRRHEVTWCDGTTQPLTDRETAILGHLALHRDRAVTRDELLQHVWGLDPRGIQTRTVDMHVARLRDKLRRDEADDAFIETVRGTGYMLADAVTVEAPS